MVGTSTASGLRYLIRQLFSRGTRWRVDNAGTRVTINEFLDLSRQSLTRRNRITDIRTVKSGEDSGHPVRYRAVSKYPRACGDPPSLSAPAGALHQSDQEAALIAVIRTKIMPPFGNAMRLVYRKERDVFLFK